MPEEMEPPRPHGDKLGASVGGPRNDPEDNQAQVQSDAPPDGPAFDEADGEQRKQQYRDGATLVSRID